MAGPVERDERGHGHGGNSVGEHHREHGADCLPGFGVVGSKLRDIIGLEHIIGGDGRGVAVHGAFVEQEVMGTESGILARHSGTVE